MKEWSCCKQRSHDFSLFLALPGCKTGKHTTEKPVLTKAAAIAKPPVTNVSSVSAASSKSECSRCRQGFFCSEHGSQIKNVNSKPMNATAVPVVQKAAPPKKIYGLNDPQICKNKGCGQTFKEKDNHDTACNHHPGPAVFHDRTRGWKCCDVFVKEFDEFIEIPPCKKGWHNSDPASC
ncbi:putative methionine--tRNA ligase [Ranunculus cassubicifolius]